MSFWNSQKIKQKCAANNLVNPYDPDAVKQCAYELSIGEEAFIPSNSSELKIIKAGVGVTIPPGQFCLLITREAVCVPADAIAFISIRAKTKFKGLVNVSGFHVDPGWNGKLKFAVYNAGSEKIHLDFGERIFLIWYADLCEATSDPRNDPPQGLPIINSQNRSDIDGDLASPAELRKQIEELTQTVKNQEVTLRSEMEQKFHAVDQHKLIIRWLLTIIITAAISAAATLYIKAISDSAKVPTDKAPKQTEGSPADVNNPTKTPTKSTSKDASK